MNFNLDWFKPWFWRRSTAPVVNRQKLEVELSTKCPIKCPLCPQAYTGDHYPGWNSGFLDVDTLFSLVRNMPQLRVLILCGAYGDPIYHPKFIEIMGRLGREYPQLVVFVETNGSYRSPEWWHELGKVTTAKHTFSFSIDGLEDSNPKYRLRADWPSMMAGIRSLRSVHRGIMQWKWIIFLHNQHQVREGYRLSKELGFDIFKLVESQRHTHESWPTAQLKDLEASLEASEDPPSPSVS